MLSSYMGAIGSLANSTTSAKYQAINDPQAPSVPANAFLLLPRANEMVPVTKLLMSAVGNVYSTPLNPTSVLTVAGQGSNANFLAMQQPYVGPGLCNLPDGHDYASLLPYSTTVMYDTLGLPVEGGPFRFDNTRTIETTPGNHLNLGRIIGDLETNRRRLPFISDVIAGKALRSTPYPMYRYTDENGVVHEALSAADPTVRKPLFDVMYDDVTIGLNDKGELCMLDGISGSGSGGAGLLRPGKGIIFLPVAPPDLAPTVAAGSGTGPGNEMYVYATSYTSPGGRSGLSPWSDPINGTAAIDLSVASVAVDSFGATGQELWRSVEGTEKWYLVTSWSDTIAHTYTDMTPDLGLTVLFTHAETTINTELARRFGKNIAALCDDAGDTGNGLRVLLHRLVGGTGVYGWTGPGTGSSYYDDCLDEDVGGGLRIDATDDYGVGGLSLNLALDPTDVNISALGKNLGRDGNGLGVLYDGVTIKQNMSGALYVDPTALGSSGASDAIYQHLGTTVGTEPRLDFVDTSSVTFTVLDNPVDHKVTVSAVASGGGGGGGGGGTGSANYGLSTDWDLTGTSGYIPWDNYRVGDNVYLDGSHPNALTIPAGGGGDYDIKVELMYEAHYSDIPWAIEYTLTIEHWRSGTRIFQQYKQDTVSPPPQDETNFSYWDIHRVSIMSAVPATVAGDLIKINFSTLIGSGATNITWQKVDGGDDLSWISIMPTGTGSGSSSLAVQHNDTAVASEPILDFEDSATVTFTTSNDSANNRVKVSAAATGGGSGGVGAHVTLIDPLFQSFSPATSWGTVAWNTVIHNDGGVFDPAHPTKLTAPSDGLYLVGFAAWANLVWSGFPTADVNLVVEIFLNDDSLVQDQKKVKIADQQWLYFQRTATVPLKAGYYIDLETRSGSASGLTGITLQGGYVNNYGASNQLNVPVDGGLYMVKLY